MKFQIAIDGPAGAGKSTVAKRVAQKLGFLYVDTGAMYRAAGLYFLESGTDLSSSEAVSRAMDSADIRLKVLEGAQHVFLNGQDVTREIRSENAGMMASKAGTIPEVRKKLVSMQKETAERESVVMDGRDIGTAVLPDADLKIFLTASVEQRAKRRYLELCSKGQEAVLSDIEKDIAKRDEQDENRLISPLRQAEDAILLDTSEMDAVAAAEKIIQLAEEKIRQEGKSL